MPITIQTPSKYVITTLTDVTLDNTIMEIKKFIEAWGGPSPEQIHLRKTLRGEPLNNDETLAQCGINDNAQLHMDLKWTTDETSVEGTTDETIHTENPLYQKDAVPTPGGIKGG